MKAVHDLGPRAVLVTSLHTDETPDEYHRLAGVGRRSAVSACAHLNCRLVVNGAGDAIAALFFAHYLRSGKIGDALSSAASAIFGVLTKTAEVGAPKSSWSPHRTKS